MSLLPTPANNPSPSKSPNPFSSLFTQEFKCLFINAIDSLVQDSGCTIPCRLVYEGCQCIECSNCLNGIYRPGGPVFFPSGKICPMCMGKRTIETQETEDINLIVIFEGKQWRGLSKDIDVKLAGGNIQTMCRIEYFSKIMAAQSIVVDTPHEHLCVNEYKREGKPEPCGLGSMEYIITRWNKR